MTSQPSVAPHEGMPSFDNAGAPLSFFEFWPMWAFYPPIVIYVAWLMLRYRGVLLPTVTNPSFPGGGFYGESKADILTMATQFASKWVAPFIALERTDRNLSINDEVSRALERLTTAGLSLPVVAKPDLGCRGAGVKLIRSSDDLSRYIAAFPHGAKYILQRLADFEGEAGIFYCRRPGQAVGKIISITLKYFPYVYGAGQTTLRDLILGDARAGKIAHLYLRRHTAKLDVVLPVGQPFRLAFAGSHSRGAIFRNGTHLVTPEMEGCFDEIAKSMREFYFGRFDIRFKSFEQVQRGEDFVVVEINGAGAESTHIWDRKTTLLQAWRTLMRQYRWLFEIGHDNRRRGFRPLSIRTFISDYRREKFLTPQYPATD